MPSNSSTDCVSTAGTASGRPANAAIPTATIAPEIRPPGNSAHRNSKPPTVPMTRVSSPFRTLLRSGMAVAIEARIRVTPPYGKFA
ncbi:hypothetical protein ACVMDN_008742 [Bradyrhizobium sp. USDA 4510]